MRLLLTLFATFFIASHTVADSIYPTFWEWKKACDKLPLFDDDEEQTEESALSWQQISDLTREFVSLMNESLHPGEQWLYRSSPSPLFYASSPVHFEPYVQRLKVPSNANVAIHGDFHGDVHSINRFIEQWTSEGFLSSSNPFQIIDPNFYIVLLGDYTDRGWYGSETIYTALRLKMANPDNVILVRGNHEDSRLNQRYGFAEELETKFPGAIEAMVYRIYNYMPVALYLGCQTLDYTDYIICCHGGLEVGYDPNPLLKATNSTRFSAIPPLNRLTGSWPIIRDYGVEVLEAVDPTRSYFNDFMPVSRTLGFLWSDFIVSPLPIIGTSSRGKSVKQFGRGATESMLNEWSGEHFAVHSIFRAHQHSSNLRKPMMQRIFNLDLQGHPDDAGIGRLWDCTQDQAGSLARIKAITFSSAPGNSFDLPYDAFGLLTIGSSYDTWQLKAFRMARRSDL